MSNSTKIASQALQVPPSVARVAISEILPAAVDWDLDHNGEHRYQVSGIPLGLLAHLYVYLQLVGEVGVYTRAKGLVRLAKDRGYDGQLRCLWSLAAKTGRPIDWKAHADMDTVALYEVRNGAACAGLSRVVSALQTVGEPVLGFFSDPGMAGRTGVDMPGITLFQGFGLAEERLARREWRIVRRELDASRAYLIARFAPLLSGGIVEAQNIVRFLYPFFHQSIRDIFAVRATLGKIGVKRVISSSDALKLGRLLALMGPSMGWKSTTVQHGATSGAYGYVPVFSDQLAVWGEESSDWLKLRGAPPEKLHVTGNPRFDMERIVPRVKATAESKVILLTNPLAWSVNQRLVEKAIAATRSVGAKLTIKTHPSEPPEPYRELCPDKSMAEVESDIGLRDLIRPGDIAVSINSSAGIEALLYGAHLVLVNEEGASHTIPFDRFGVARVVNDSEDLRKEIISFRTRTPEHNQPAVDSFLKRYLGPLDGGAASRVADLVLGRSS